jgi:hypothetical protein
MSDNSFGWSRRERVRASENDSSVASGFTTSTSRKRRCAFWWRRTSASRRRRRTMPSSVSISRCAWWMARVCARLSSIASTRQRFMSSSSTVSAVVVEMTATGPSTSYVCVTCRPLVVSFPVEAIFSRPSLCNSFSA